MKEWRDLVISINPVVILTSARQNDVSIILTLKLPLAGHRSISDATYYYQGTYGFYWAASPYSTYGHSLNLNSSQIYPLNYNNRTLGFSIRCIKN